MDKRLGGFAGPVALRGEGERGPYVGLREEGHLAAVRAGGRLRPREDLLQGVGRRRAHPVRARAHGDAAPFARHRAEGHPLPGRRGPARAAARPRHLRDPACHGAPVRQQAPQLRRVHERAGHRVRDQGGRQAHRARHAHMRREPGHRRGFHLPLPHARTFGGGQARDADREPREPGALPWPRERGL